MKYTNILTTSGLCLVLALSSCGTILTSSKQNVTIKTTSDDAVVYLNNEKFAEGKETTKKIERKGNYSVVIDYGEEYIQHKSVLMPLTKTVPIFKVGLFLNYITIPVFGLGIFGIQVDKEQKKVSPYAKEIFFDKVPEKLPVREDDAKYLYLSNISLDIENTDDEFVFRNGVLLKEDLHSLEACEKRLDEEFLSNKLKEAEREARRKSKKKKEKEYLVEEKKDLKYNDVVFTEDLMQTLYEGGFTDTVNNVFSDNNNTLILEGKIDNVLLYRISHFWNGGTVCQSKTNLVWYIKNTYGEILDSVVDNSLSNAIRFPPYSYQTTWDQRQAICTKSTVESSVTKSFYRLLEGEAFNKYSKIITDFNPKLEPTKLNRPVATVADKRDAAEASVIIKTDAGHGSGFAITNDGYVVTNYHVIAADQKALEDMKVTVIDFDGKELEGTVEKVNKFQDIALIKVENEFSKAFYCSNEKSFRKMDDIYTIGAPKSITLGQSISSGLISNERKINNNYLLQLGMSINSGNSGGPIFDTKGTLHGVVVSKLVGRNTEGVSFAVPSYLLQEYLNIQY
jgi:S1-C subfamily serine protease